MIAPIRTDSTDHRTEICHDQFLAMLPRIRRNAWIAYRHLNSEAREEMIQEVIASAYRSWVRLVRQGKQAVAFASPLAEFAIRHVHDGRRVGSRGYRRDLLSHAFRRRQGIRIERLHQHNPQSGDLHERLIEDRRAGPAETAAARIDLAAWLGTLSLRNRRIAQALAQGESTATVALQFKLSPGRISQLRGWFRRCWERFQGEAPSAGVANAPI